MKTQNKIDINGLITEFKTTFNTQREEEIITVLMNIILPRFEGVFKAGCDYFNYEYTEELYQEFVTFIERRIKWYTSKFDPNYRSSPIYRAMRFDNFFFLKGEKPHVEAFFKNLKGRDEQ